MNIDVICSVRRRNLSWILRNTIALIIASCFFQVAFVGLNVGFQGLQRGPSYPRLRNQVALSADGVNESVAKPMPQVVAVVGATGKLGVQVVRQLLQKGVREVRAIMRDQSKAEDSFADLLGSASADGRLNLCQCDVEDKDRFAEACRGADAAMWCVSGGAGGSPLDKAMLLAKAALNWPSTDEIGLEGLGSIFAGIEKDGLPKVIMCSSAAVTRPTWSEEKRSRLPGCADIPIVRLNPFGILDKKRQSEDALRNSGAPYVIVRPVGLNDNWPRGRPVITQGDVAVGKISRIDLASVMIAMLSEVGATDKTFEVLAVAGYPEPVGGYSRVLSSLREDKEPANEAVVAATYDLLQQLLPGEKQESAGLAMGQTYEQFDSGVEGKLGPRGQERVPERIS